MDGLSERIRRAGSIAWSALGILLLAWVLVRLLALFGVVIPPLLMAALIFVIVHPAVTWLEERGVKRYLGTSLSFLVLILLLAGFATLMIPLVVAQGRELINQLPSLLAQYRSGIEGETGALVDTWADRLAALARGEDLLSTARQGFSIAGSVIATVFSLILGAVLAFYAVADFPRIRRGVRAVIPPRALPMASQIFERTLQTTTEFMRVRLLLGLVVGVLGTIGFRLIGLRYWLILGIILGVTNLIPILGTYLGAIPALLVALLTMGPVGAAWTLGVVMASAAVDGYFLTPILMHQQFDLHPIAIILAILVGGAWYGVWGVLFVIPLLAAGKSLVSEYLRLRGYLPEPRDRDEAVLPLPLEEAIGG